MIFDNETFFFIDLTIDRSCIDNAVGL